MTTIDLTVPGNLTVDVVDPVSEGTVDIFGAARPTIEVIGGGLPGPPGANGAPGPSFRVVQIQVTPPAGTLVAGSRLAQFFVPAEMNGWKLSAVAAACVVASSSGGVSVQLTNNGVPILATPLTLDQGVTRSSHSSVPAVIDGAQNTLHTDDLWSIDVSAAGTGTIGLILNLVIELV